MSEQAPKKPDPFVTAERVVDRLVMDNRSGAMGSEKFEATLAALQSVMIVRAMDRLTEAVQDNTRIATQWLNLEFERDANGR